MLRILRVATKIGRSLMNTFLKVITSIRLEVKWVSADLIGLRRAGEPRVVRAHKKIVPAL